VRASTATENRSWSASASGPRRARPPRCPGVPSDRKSRLARRSGRRWLRRSGQGSGRLRSPLAERKRRRLEQKPRRQERNQRPAAACAAASTTAVGLREGCRGRTRAWPGRPTSVGQQRSRHPLPPPARRHRVADDEGALAGQRGWTGLPSGSWRALLLYLLVRRFARPFAVRPLPRARAAFPLAPAERLPVNLENASSIRPADLSTKPSALSRRPDFIAPSSPRAL
jgi:hypothetical protein